MTQAIVGGFLAGLAGGLAVTYWRKWWRKLRRHRAGHIAKAYVRLRPDTRGFKDDP